MNEDQEEDIDFDYSQTHLEDFLKSQNRNTLLKNSNVHSTQLLNTFLSSYSKMKSGTNMSLKGLTAVGGDSISQP